MIPSDILVVNTHRHAATQSWTLPLMTLRLKVHICKTEIQAHCTAGRMLAQGPEHDRQGWQPPALTETAKGSSYNCTVMRTRSAGTQQEAMEGLEVEEQLVITPAMDLEPQPSKP